MRVKMIRIARANQPDLIAISYGTKSGTATVWTIVNLQLWRKAPKLQLRPSKIPFLPRSFWRKWLQLKTTEWQILAEKRPHLRRVGSWIVPPTATIVETEECSVGIHDLPRRMSGRFTIWREELRAKTSDMGMWDWLGAYVGIVSIK